MNYIELIKRFWQLHELHQFNVTETALYFHLVEICNRCSWTNPFKRNSARICSDLGVSINTLKNARNRLMQSGLIEVNGKQGSANITYKLKTSSKFDEVSNEVSSEVGIEVSIEVDTKLDATKDKLNKTKLNNKNSEILPEKFPFERAWELYGRKGNKKTSMRKWGSLKNDCREAAMKHIPPYVKATPDKQYRKNFETYLNQEAWHDEIVSPTMAQKQKKEDHYGYKESECVG